MASSDMHPGLEHSGPLCLRCKSSTALYYVNPWNPNGNAGRPYYKCINTTCGKFATFADLRGIHNPLSFGQNVFCRCPSYNLPRLQVAGQGKRNPGALHWVCATGRCNTFVNWLDGGGNVRVLDPHRIACWIQAGLL
jgi:hypothetical protein